MFRARSAGSRRLAALLVVSALWACKPVDTDRPHAPTLDRLTGRTTRATWLLTGAAEPGARIVITRLPLLDAGAIPEVHASPADARFQVEVPLAPHVQNVFLVSAMDDAGLGSEATEVKVDQVAPAPGSVTLEVSDAAPRIGADGKAQLKARATVAMDDGSSPEGQPVVFHVDSLDHLPDLSGRADAAGQVVVTVRGLAKVGPGKLTATVPGSDLASEDVPYLVRAGDAVTATLQLSAPGSGGPVVGNDITVPVDVDVSAKLSAQDAAGNPVPAAFTLSAAPEALVAGGIVRFVSAGRYTVTAHVATGGGASEITTDATVTATATATHDASPRLAASFPAFVTSGVPAAYHLTVLDAEGGALEATGATVTLSDTRGQSSTTAKTLTFSTAGRQTATFRLDTADGQHLSAEVVTVVRPGPVAALEALLAGNAAPLSNPRAASPKDVLALTVTAKDAAGNVVSDPPLAIDADPGVDVFGTTITAPAAPGTYAIAITSPGSSARAVAVLSVAAQPAANVTVRCPAQATAGVPFPCSAEVTDASGHAVTTAVTWTVEPPSAGSVANGRVNLTAAGAATVKATAGAVQGTASVQTAPAAASQLQLSVSPATLTVGQTATVSTKVTDAFGNELGVPVALSTDIPGALVGGGALSNVTRAGSYRVIARTSPQAGDSGLEAVQPVTVTADAAGQVRLTLSATKTTAGQPVKVTTAVKDAFGNPVTGNPVVALTVDGAVPNGIAAAYVAASGDLTVFTPGPHRVTATSGTGSDSTILDATPAADTLAPDVSVWLDRYVPSVPAPQYYKPGQTVGVTVRARDDRGLAGIRVRVSSSDFGVLFDQAVPLDQPVAEFERLFAVPLPTSRIGTFTVTATASDTANHSTDAAPVAGTVDFHYDRFALAGVAAAARARSVSVDPALVSPGALAYTAGVPVAIATLGGTPVAVSPGAGGLVAKAFDLGANVTDFNGLAASPAGNLFFTAHQNGGTADDQMLFRLVPGVPAPQAYTEPPLATDMANARLTGVAIDVRSTSGTVFAGEASLANASPIQGRLYSMPLRDGASGYTVNVTLSGGSREVWVGTLADLRPQQLCVQDVANPTELYFTADRIGTTRMVGLYKVALTSGHLPAGALTATTLFEEPKDISSGGVVSYGPCVHHPASGSVLFASSAQATNGSYFGGRVLGCAATGCTVSTLVRVVLPASGLDLGPLGGMVRAGSALYLDETSTGRMFRLDGVF